MLTKIQFICFILLIGLVGMSSCNSGGGATKTPDGAFYYSSAETLEKLAHELTPLEKKYLELEKKIAFEAKPHKTFKNEQNQLNEMYKAVDAKYKNVELKKLYYPNGNKLGQGWIRSDKGYGIWLWWHEDTNPQIKRRQVYGENGLLQGMETIWYWTGVKQADIHYKDGQRNGITKSWKEGGELEYESVYKNGERTSIRSFDE